MTVEFKKIAIGTEFTYEGRKYSKGSSGWSKDDVPVLSAYPFLGGKLQNDESFKIWIPADTQVQVREDR